MLYRFISIARSGAETTYSYDPNSNRLTSIDTATSDIDLDGLFDRENLTQSARQTINLDAASNRLLGFSQTLVQTRNGNAISSVTSQVNYALDANGAMTSDGLRTFDYDESRRLSKVRILKDGEAAKVFYLHNALGQRVFKSDPKAEQTLPDETKLGPGFTNWLRKNFGWLFSGQGQSTSSIGMAFAYDEAGNLLGEYDNGSAAGRGRTEYIWLPTDSGQSIPVGMYRNGKFYAIHADHLGTPRLITDQENAPVWQWPYSAFGSNKPTGVLAATMTAGTTKLKATKTGLEANMRFPGQYFDEESNLSYNYFRSYNGSQGRYTQADLIRLGGGVNRFTYLGGNPISRIDPSGRSWLSIGLGIAGACYAAKKIYDNIIDVLDGAKSLQDAAAAGRQNQNVQRAMNEWYAGGMKGEPPYTEAQMQAAVRAVVNAAGDVATTMSKVPGTSVTGPVVDPKGPMLPPREQRR